MTKDIKDYLPLYLGQRCYIPKYDRVEKLIQVSSESSLGWFRFSSPDFDGWAEFKLLLRPLSSMTEEEYEELECAGGNIENIDDEWRFVRTESAQTKYLLSKGFDLFGLIESGLALDLTQHP